MLKVELPTKSFLCEHCGKRFSHSGSYSLHLRLHQTGSVELQCLFCSKQCVRPVDLERHLRIHTLERPHFCKVCPADFNQYGALRKHLLTHEVGRVKKFSCELCPKTYDNLRELDIHLLTHLKEKPFKCDVCEKRFGTENKLGRHSRMHRDERPVSCEVCGKSFKQKQYLKLHLRLHTGERPYECEICNKSFLQMTHRNSHMRRIHNYRKGQVL